MFRFLYKTRRRFRVLRRVIFRWALRLGLVLAALVLAANLWVILSVDRFIYHSTATLPDNEYGLVLGTSNLLRNGRPNPFFVRRMEAAAALYHSGKVKRLLLSGHRDSRHYDEPRLMASALEKLGVPKEVLVRDGAGHRTLDSIMRAEEIHQIRRFTIISQQDHIYRALFIAKHEGFDAIAYAAEPAPPLYTLRVGVREVGARVKAVLDLYLFRRPPLLQTAGSDSGLSFEQSLD